MAQGTIASEFVKKNVSNEIIVKVTIVGDSQIGKTTLIVKYIEGKFDEEFIETLGLNVMEKSFKLKNVTANLQIYDLGGQKQFAELMPTAMEGTKAVIFAFDLTQQGSLRSVKRWFREARSNNKVFKPILVGTKYDLFQEKDNNYKTEITKLARQFASNMKAPLIYSSSKDNTHVKQVFTIVVGYVFDIKIKSKAKSRELKEPLLEYDIIYKKKDKKRSKKKPKKNKQNKSLKTNNNNNNGNSASSQSETDDDINNKINNNNNGTNHNTNDDDEQKE